MQKPAKSNYFYLIFYFVIILINQMELLTLAYILIYKKYIKNINIYYFTQSGKQLYLQNVNVVKFKLSFLISVQRKLFQKYHIYKTSGFKSFF